jgi:putative ABC transport system permease protein
MRERLTRLFDNARQDLRYALRGLGRSPGFTVAVTLTLALGIGANAAMFGVVDRLMFRPFPYLRDPASVDRVYLEATYRGKARTQSTFPYTRFLDLRRATSSFSESAGFSEWRLAIGSGEAAREYQTLGVSASFFDFFNARPVLGRFFNASEDVVPRGADVVVISHSYWKNELAGRDVLGEKLQIGPLLLTVIGVAPDGFVGVAEGEAPAAFIPITTFAFGLNQGDAESFARRYNWDWMSMMVRRKPGVSRDMATRDLTNAFIQSRDLARVQLPSVLPANVAHPRGIAGALKTAAGPDAGLESRTLLWVSGVALIVLLIACANVANLMFARVLRRRREIAVRLALGVARSRLAAQHLTEGLILATLGCLAGIVMAQWLSAALRQLLINDGSTSGLALEWRSLGIASLLAVVAALITSIGPTLLAVREDLAATLRAGARSTHQRSRIRSTLLVLQAALSVALLIGAGLFVRSLDHVRSVRLGWDPEPVLIVTPNYRGLAMDPGGEAAFRRRLLLAARAIPGVQYATRINSLPFATNTMDFKVPGVDSVQRIGRFNFQATTPDYFKALDTRIIRGRAFTDRDRDEHALVTVVSQAMARALWPSEDPIGKCMYLRPLPTSCVSVIGVAEDVAQSTIDDNERLMFYLPDEQPPFSASNRLVLRMSGDALSQMERVRRALQQIMPGEAYVTVSSLDGLVDRQRRSWRLGATMFVGFGVLALIVAAVGLYGVIAYGVTQRMHELGVRVALGAGAANIVRLVVGQSIAFAGSGVAIGLMIALIAARWLQPLLFEQSATDPVVFVAVGILIGLVALVASALPALRATRADPNSALRSE